MNPVIPLAAGVVFGAILATAACTVLAGLRARPVAPVGGVVGANGLTIQQCEDEIDACSSQVAVVDWAKGYVIAQQRILADPRSVPVGYRVEVDSYLRAYLWRHYDVLSREAASATVGLRVQH